MREKDAYFKDLFIRWMSGTASDEEQRLFMDLAMQKQYEEELVQLLEQDWASTKERMPIAEALYHKIMLATNEEQISIEPSRRVHFLRNAWFRYAAILLLLAGTATYLYLNNQSQKEIAVKQPSNQPNIILPGGNKATLTLADGSTIVLDSAANGSLASQGNTKIIKLDAGKLAYRGNSVAGEVGFNTITTPKGGLYQVILPDGSSVWLNAASSVRFPTAFTGEERKVEVTGEVYVQVAADKNKPFHVQVNGVSIQVLGTTFNVNAYVDESAVRTTLIAGSIKVNKGENGAILKPGQQAAINEKVLLLPNVDIDQIIAWKNGIFNFENVSLDAALRQLSKWYDIEIVYEKGVPDIKFGGGMKRNLSIDDMLDFLKGMNVHFKLEGHRLIILP